MECFLKAESNKDGKRRIGVKQKAGPPWKFVTLGMDDKSQGRLLAEARYSVRSEDFIMPEIVDKNPT